MKNKAEILKAKTLKGATALLCVFCIAQVLVTNGPSESVTFAWDAVPGATGYRVYWGYTNGLYPFASEVVTTNRVRLTNIALPVFAVCVAIDGEGLESAFSNWAARLPDATDVFYAYQDSSSPSGPFGPTNIFLVRSNVAGSPALFTRLKVESRKRFVAERQ